MIMVQSFIGLSFVNFGQIIVDFVVFEGQAVDFLLLEEDIRGQPVFLIRIYCLCVFGSRKGHFSFRIESLD